MVLSAHGTGLRLLSLSAAFSMLSLWFLMVYVHFEAVMDGGERTTRPERFHREAREDPSAPRCIFKN